MSLRSALTLPDWAQMSEARRAHVERVAVLLAGWGDAMGIDPVERGRWLRAAAYHDAVKDAPRATLRDLAPDAWGSDRLRHGPAAAELARRDGERDQDVLDAVRYHSVGFAGWDRVGRMLYMADYLEPGRRHQPPELEELAAIVPSDPERALRTVAQFRIAHHLRRGRPLLRETVEFWNDLVCGA